MALESGPSGAEGNVSGLSRPVSSFPFATRIMSRDSSGRRLACARLAPRVIAASLLLAAAAASASDLTQAVDRLIVQGFEDPQGAQAGLRALQAATPATPDNTRALLVGLGMVAADSHLAKETAEVAKALRELAATAGPVAEADAHLVNANLEFEGMQEENGNIEARAAVAGYAPLCESRDPALAARCDRYNWFYALLFAAYGAHGERNPAAAAIYLHSALDAAQQAGSRALEIKADAILASLAQGDNDAELAERLLARAQALAKLEGDPALLAYVQSFSSDVLADREQYEASRDAIVQAIRISRDAGLKRREAEYELSLSGAELRLEHPAAALAALDRAQAFLATHSEPGLQRQRLHDQAIALLALGRTAEAREKLHEALARYDRETGPNARIGALRDLGPALARAGDRAGALELYQREQQLLQAKNDGRYERDMQQVQRLIHDEQERLQSRRTAQWSGAAVACVVLALAIAFMARRQVQRNRLLARRNRALRIQAEHDPLTGLANRAHLRTRLSARGARHEGALFLVDVDHFKEINDRHGHAVGDAVLVAIARRLEGVLRERDLVVRWGGEEFLVVVDAMPADEAVALARRLMKAFADSPIVVEGQSIAVSASIGFAVFPVAGKSHGVGFEAAFALVDAAMYHSKSQGRACATRVVSVDAGLQLEQTTLPTSLAGGAILEVHRPAEELVPA